MLNKGFSGTLSYTFKSQISPGYAGNIGSDIVSRFFATATMILGAGATWKYKGLAVTFTPLTGNVQFVSDENLRVRYGNDPEKLCRWEMGANLAPKCRASRSAPPSTPSPTISRSRRI